MQICEQKNEKKNRIAIEYLIFFSHLINLIKLLNSFCFFYKNLEKITIKIEGPIWRNRPDGSGLLW